LKKIAVVFLVTILILFQVNIFSQDPYQEGMKFYINAMDAFQNREYLKAQKLLEEALKVYPNIESKVKDIKLILGISAFYNGDYEKAKTFLELFRDNPIAQELLKKIPENIEEKSIENMGFIKENEIYEGSKTIVTTTDLATNVGSKNPSIQFLKVFLLGLIVFLISFLSILFIEYKFKFITNTIEKLLSKIPSKTIESSSNDQSVENAPRVSEAKFNDSSVNKSNVTFYNVNIEEYSRKDLEGIDEILREAENLEADQSAFTSSGTEDSSPREAILSSFRSVPENDSKTLINKKSKEKLKRYTTEDTLELKAEQIIKELKAQKEKIDSEWVSADKISTDLSEKIRELEDKETYNKNDIERILEYVSKEVSENERG